MKQSPWGGPKLEYSGHLEHTPSCPGCGKGLDGFTALEPGVQPNHGSISICMYCGLELEFYGEPLMLRRLKGEELILARANPKFRRVKKIVMGIIAKRRASSKE